MEKKILGCPIKQANVAVVKPKIAPHETTLLPKNSSEKMKEESSLPSFASGDSHDEYDKHLKSGSE